MSMRSLGQVVRSPITLLANWVPYVDMIVAWHVRPVAKWKVGPMRPMMADGQNMGPEYGAWSSRHPYLVHMNPWWIFDHHLWQWNVCFYHGTCDSFNDDMKPLDFRVDFRVTRFLIWEQPPNHWPNHPITPSLFLKWQFQYQILIKWYKMAGLEAYKMAILHEGSQPLQNLIYSGKVEKAQILIRVLTMNCHFITGGCSGGLCRRTH